MVEWLVPHGEIHNCHSVTRFSVLPSLIRLILLPLLTLLHFLSPKTVRDEDRAGMRRDPGQL